jgi:DNA-binding CsgD family transcriptional regulator
MRWLAKAALQRGLGFLPHGERLNYLFQRHIARSLPGGEPVVRRKLARARQHLEAFGRPAGDAVFYEFGAGWDLAIPLSYAALGVGRQVLVDIRPSARPELVNESLAAFERLWDELEQEAERELRRLGLRRARRTRPGAPGAAGVASLTERELEVARLIVDRRTNPQIAAELFLSQKTVESHVRNLFTKLGVASRVEVARAVERADRAAAHRG